MNPLLIPLAASVVGAGAGAYGARQARKAAEGQTESSERMRREAMQAIQNFGQAALEPLAPAYQRSQDINEAGFNRALALTGQMFRPALEQFREGNYMAQQRIAEAQPFMQSAILGTGSLGYMPQAQNVGGQIDYSVLNQLTNPEPMQFTAVPGGQTTQAAPQTENPVDLMQRAMMRFQTDGNIDEAIG